MRTALLLLALFAPPLAADVGGVWGPAPALNVARQECGAARSQNFVVVVGGLLPGPGVQATASTEVMWLDNHGYLAPWSQWQVMSPMPEPRDHHAVCTAPGFRVHVFGGFAGDFVARASTWAYEPVTDTWQVRAPLPAARGAAWAVTHGSRIYVFGGVSTAGVAQRSTFVFDPGTNTWSQGADMPTAREHLTAAALGSYIHVVGGRNGASTGAHERYDPALDQWVSLAPLPTPRAAAATAVYDGRLLVIGGETPQLFALNEVYDPATGQWSRQDPMPVPRHGVGAVVIADRILVPGGGVVQGLQPTAHVDTFRPLPVNARHACACAAGAPCGNTAREAGCRNSTGAGAELTAVGRASVSGDTLELVASHSPSTAPVLFFQGNALAGGGAGAPFQDGLRCATGNVVRLGTKTASDGSARYPEPGDVAVSMRGGVASPVTRHYQAWYRNLAGPCGTGSNLTNAVTVDWDA